MVWAGRMKVKLRLLTRIRISFRLEKQSCSRDENLLHQNRVLLLSPLAPAGPSAILSFPIEARPLIFRVPDAPVHAHLRRFYCGLCPPNEQVGNGAVLVLLLLSSHLSIKVFRPMRARGLRS